MQLPELAVPPCPGPWLPSPATSSCSRRKGAWRTPALPLAAVAAGLAHLRLRGAARADPAKQVPRPSLAQADSQRLNAHLLQLSSPELREILKQIGEKSPKSLSRAQLITRLTKPAVIKKTKAWVLPDEDAIPAISAETLRELEFHLETVAAQNLPKGAGHGRSQQAEVAVQTARASDTEQEPLQICEVRVPLLKKAKRRGLESLKEGDAMSGTVVEVSLGDGLRVDIGAEVDALLPIALEEREVAKQVSAKYPLGTKISVQIEDVSEDPARRFPVIASFSKTPAIQATLKIEQARTALRPHDGALESSRGAGQVQLDVLDDWQPEGKLLVQKELEALPARPPPEVVRSLGRNGQLQEVEVPEAMRGPAAKKDVSASARKAWASFAEEQVVELRSELRCRDRLASDLLVVEADLLQGRLPSIPIELLGLTVLADGKSCLLPRPEGDCLKFQSLTFDAAQNLHNWTEDCREGWAAKAAEPSTKQQLAQYFACADAWHARMVQAAEAVEIQKLGWGREDEDDGDLAAEMDRMIANTAELQDQESMEAVYLLKDMDESELADLGRVES